MVGWIIYLLRQVLYLLCTWLNIRCDQTWYDGDEGVSFPCQLHKFHKEDHIAAALNKNRRIQWKR